MARSLRNDPNQFSYQVNLTVENITGLHSVASAPGAIGTSVVMGPGASGTGIKVTAGITDADISFANGLADAAAKAHILSAAATIEAIADELTKGGRDSKNIGALLANLSKLAVPAVVAGVVQAIIQLTVPG